jgi:hypothetical protein
MYKEKALLEERHKILAATLEQKDLESKREQDATTTRDKAYDDTDKRLRSIQRDIQNLAKSQKELRDLLDIVIPPDLLRGLRSYANHDQHKTEGARTDAQAPRNPTSAPRSSNSRRLIESLPGLGSSGR